MNIKKCGCFEYCGSFVAENEGQRDMTHSTSEGRMRE